jgi:hypothetical protein
MAPAHIEFLEPYADRFRAGTGTGTLYTELTNAWIEKFGYEGLPENGKDPVDVADLRLDANIVTLPAAEKEKVLKLRNQARNAIRMVRIFLICLVEDRTDGEHRKSGIGSGTSTVSEKRIRWASREY